MKIKIPFSKFVNDVEVHSNVSDVLDGEEIDQVEELERECCEYIGAHGAVATSHGTTALHLAMLALELKRGDKVVCSINAHPNIPEVVRHFDAEPIFIDIEAESYNIDLDLLETYLKENRSKKLKAVLVTHIAGVSVDLERLYVIAQENSVKVVEDASYALGAMYNGKKIGATGADITCFDFSPHMKNSICNGGMLVTDDKALLEARLNAAKSQVDAAEKLLASYELKAPFAGTLTDINVEVGQLVGPELWAAQLADLSEYYVETSDLTELEVVKITNGQNVEIVPDALPELVLTGSVESIGQSFKTQAGDIVYTVKIRLDDTDPNLRWGMTVEVTFLAE